MKKTISKSEFREEFERFNRNNFSYEGLGALFDYFEDCEECGIDEIELDVIAFCCEFTEYEDLAEFHQNYDADQYPDMESISESTTVIRIEDTDSFIIADF